MSNINPCFHQVYKQITYTWISYLQSFNKSFNQFFYQTCIKSGKKQIFHQISNIPIFISFTKLLKDKALEMGFFFSLIKLE